jgi:predicted nucleic acid-binding protein
MDELFVDTNVFLRFLTADDPRKADRAQRLFRQAVEGKIKLNTSPLVIAEIIWTLESFYGLGKPDIAAKVEKILNTPNLDCADGGLILHALALYAGANIDFIDAYHAFWLKARAQKRIATYDRKHFARVAWLEIVEP